MTPPSWRQAPIAALLPETPSPIRLGLGANWRQFTLLVVVNAFVGAMVGLERTVVPPIAQADFGLVSKTVVLSFLVSFGIVKALANLFAGQRADRIGRKPLLVAGWLAGLPVPLLIIWAPSWGWIVFANVLLGVNQGLCWSTTVIMKIDLVGPARRDLAGPRAVRGEPSRNGQQSERRDGVGTHPRVSRRARGHARPHRRRDRGLPPGVGNRPARNGRAERPLGTEVDDRYRDVGAGGGHHGIRRGPLLRVLDGRRHTLGDRDRAGLPHPTRGRVGRRAPRLARERRGG